MNIQEIIYHAHKIALDSWEPFYKSNNSVSKFYMEIKDKNIETIRRICSERIYKGEPINNKGDYGLTILHLLAKEGKDDVIKLLIEEFNADPTIKDQTGRQPIHLAATFGRIDTLRYLSPKVNSIDVRDGNGYTPFISACVQGSVESVKLLIDMKADTTLETKRGESGWELAAIYGRVNVMELLLQKKCCQVDMRVSHNQTALGIAAETGNVALGKFLLSKGADPEKTSGLPKIKPIHRALMESNQQFVEFLQKEGKANINAPVFD